MPPVGHQPWVDFATRDKPLRISSLPKLSRCQMAAFLKWREELDNSDSHAAAKGRVVGRAIELWLQPGNSVKEAGSQALAEVAGGEYLPDPDEVMEALEGYASDPRNAQAGLTPTDERYGVVLLDSLELEVPLTLPPHELDPTGEPVYCLGHTDQFRRLRRNGIDGRLAMWDLKHSGRDPGLMNWEYAYQLAGYATAVSQMYGEPVDVGGIILTTRYLGKRYKNGKVKPAPGDAFLESGLTQEAVDAMMDDLRLNVAMIRRGLATRSPGEHCDTGRWHCMGGPQACTKAFRQMSETVPDMYVG